MPTEQEWLKYHAWAERYGDVMYLSVFGQPVIILDSARATTALLEKKSSLYADRPRLPLAGEMVGYKDSIPLCAYGPRHREYRKLLSSSMSQRKIEAWRPVHEQKTRKFLTMLLDTPEDIVGNIQQTVAGTVFQISHGYTLTGKNDQLYKLAKQASDDFCVMVSPGAFLVDTFPILRHVPDWFPGAGFKQKAKEWRATADKLKDEPYNDIKNQIAKGTALPSFTASLIEMNPHPSAEEENLYKWATAGMYSAGSDTTVSAILSFFLAMTVYPEVQKKAQAEIDRVVGDMRLPNFDDRERLPYIVALIYEVYRWNPVGPLAIPHRLIQDDVFDGYHIPGGSIVIANSWAILHNPAQYPSPMEFQPERYLNRKTSSSDEATLNPDPHPYAFGYGRRVCPGQHVADSSLYMAVVMTLATFNITKAVGNDGHVIEPSLKYTSGTISQPEPFKCTITPRSTAAAELVQSLKVHA